MPIHEVLALPLDKGALLAEVRELRLARGQGQDTFYHLDTFEHIIETVRAVERELAKGRIVARMGKGGTGGSGWSLCSTILAGARCRRWNTERSKFSAA